MADTMSKTEEMALINQAIEFGKQREFDKAIEVLKNLVQIRPTHELGLGMLASIYAEIGMQDRAINLYRKILEINPSNPLAGFQLGLAQFRAGETEQALATWESSLTEDDFMFHFHCGLALQKLNRVEEAKPMFEHAAKTMPNTHALYGQLQEIRKSLG